MSRHPNVVAAVFARVEATPEFKGLYARVKARVTEGFNEFVHNLPTNPEEAVAFCRSIRVGNRMGFSAVFANLLDAAVAAEDEILMPGGWLGQVDLRDRARQLVEDRFLDIRNAAITKRDAALARNG